jgi:hypothetical protein
VLLLITHVFGHQDDVGTTLAQALAHRLAVHCRNHNVAVFSGDRAINNSHIAIEDPGAFHAVAFDAHQVNMRSSDVQELVDGNVLLKVIRSRRWESRRDFKRVKRELDSPFC